MARDKMKARKSDADAHERFEKIVQALRNCDGVTAPTATTRSSRRFGSTALKINSKIFAMISSKGQFVVRLPERRVDALIASGQGERFDAGRGRPMREWLTVHRSAERTWQRLATEAMRFVASTYATVRSVPRRRGISVTTLGLQK